MNRNFIRKTSLLAIVIFVVVYTFIVLSKTPLIYNKEVLLESLALDILPEVLPAWLVAILVAIILIFQSFTYIDATDDF